MILYIFQFLFIIYSVSYILFNITIYYINVFKIKNFLKYIRYFLFFYSKIKFSIYTLYIQ